MAAPLVADRRLSLAAARHFLHAQAVPLVLIGAVLPLTVWHYLARADRLATGHGDGWTAMTGTPLPAWLHFALSAILLAVLPVVVARLATGKSLPELGLGLGDVRRGLGWLAFGLPLAILAGRIGAADPSIRAVYPLDPTLTAAPREFLTHTAAQWLYFGAWEVLFRGVLLFGLKDRLGTWPAIVLQTALSVLAHFSRPLPETASAIPAGIVFGWVTLRTGSIWYIAIIHWLEGVALNWFIVTGAW
jgi:membrane protease YdiL (CAAX protease family)